jgi:hypothetical protein
VYELTDEQLVSVLRKAKDIERFVDSVKTHLQSRLERGEKIPGVKLIEGRGGRAWGFPEEAMVKKLVRLGVPKKHCYKTSLVSPAQLEKLKWEDKTGNATSLTKEQLQTARLQFIKYGEGAPVIALSDAHGTEVNVEVLKFDPIGENQGV